MTARRGRPTPPKRRRARPSLAAARRAKLDHAPALWGFLNVIGVGVGFKRVAGRTTDLPCVRVYVRRKVPRDELPADQVLPREVGGVPVDVVEARFRVRAEPTDRHNPMPGGVSIGTVAVVPGGTSAGTLGVSVFDRRSGEDRILTNHHVVCADAGCPPGDEVLQPGDGDDGDPGLDVVALTDRAVSSDRVDAAIARLTGARFLLGEIRGIGEVTGTATARIGTRIRMAARTSGLVEGEVTDDDADVEVAQLDGSTRLMRGQIVIENGGEEVSRGGDSGGVWVDASNRVVGLNFAGGPGVGVANHIADVLDALDIDILPGVRMQHFIAATQSSLN